MISNLKLGLASRKKEPLSPRKPTPRKDGTIRKIGVVFDLDGLKSVDRFLKLKDDLHIKEGDFHTITCMAAKPKTKDPEGLVFSPAGLSLTGRIKDPKVREYISCQFDVLISFCQKENKATRIIMKECSAGIKVGRLESGSEYHDLAISTPIEEVDVFIEETIKYLKIFKKIPQ